MATIDELKQEWDAAVVGTPDHPNWGKQCRAFWLAIRENERLTRELAAAIKLERVWRACWQNAEDDLKEIDRLLTESDSNIDVAHQIAIDAGKAYESAPDAALKGVKSDEHQ